MSSAQRKKYKQSVLKQHLLFFQENYDIVKYLDAIMVFVSFKLIVLLLREENAIDVLNYVIIS